MWLRVSFSEVCVWLAFGDAGWGEGAVFALGAHCGQHSGQAFLLPRWASRQPWLLLCLGLDAALEGCFALCVQAPLVPVPGAPLHLCLPDDLGGEHLGSGLTSKNLNPLPRSLHLGSAAGKHVGSRCIFTIQEILWGLWGTCGTFEVPQAIFSFLLSFVFCYMILIDVFCLMYHIKRAWRMMCLAYNVSYGYISLQKHNALVLTLLTTPVLGYNDAKQCFACRAGKSLRHPVSHVPAPELEIHSSNLFQV